MQKEKDLELAAKIGQSLLQQNKQLDVRIETLEEQVTILSDQVCSFICSFLCLLPNSFWNILLKSLWLVHWRTICTSIPSLQINIVMYATSCVIIIQTHYVQVLFWSSPRPLASIEASASRPFHPYFITSLRSGVLLNKSWFWATVSFCGQVLTW